MGKTLYILSLVAMISSAAHAGPVSVEGDWLTPGDRAHVVIAPCGPSICGTITQSTNRPDGTPPQDTHNPDPKLRARPIVGIQLIGGFRKDGDGWSGGTIYNPDDGKTYKSKLALLPDGTLKVSGCVLFFCKAQIWHRAK